MSSIPPDLRVANKPLLQRLSPASAGIPGDDNADIQVIRDEWVRNKARSLAQQARRRLSLRLGTFNVNGKMPSQDLSSWIQGTRVSGAELEKTGGSPFIPPLKATPPISLEDVTKPLRSSKHSSYFSWLVVMNMYQMIQGTVLTPRRHLHLSPSTTSQIRICLPLDSRNSIFRLKPSYIQRVL